VEEGEVLRADVGQRLSKHGELRNRVIKILLVDVGVEEGRCVGRLGQLLIELVEHVAQQDLYVEVSLNPVNDVNPIKVSLLVEPAMGGRRLQYEGNSKFPDANMIRNKVKHCTQVLLAPVVSELFDHPL
jgi:hypothetical protein